MTRVGKRVHALSVVLLCLTWAAAALGQTKAIPQRSDIEDEYKWRLEDIYETTAAWEADFERVESQLPALAAMQGRLAASADGRV